VSEAAGKTSATMSEALESTAQSTRQTRDEPAAVVEALRADSLRKSYRGRCVVNNVSVTVSRGEVVGLLGPNGAGKTTTFYMIVGLESPDSGRISLGAQDVTRWPMYRRARRGISYLPQEPSIFRKLTVEENLLAILETLRISRAERQ
jgi:lipopolysaccharide export system ATP-binding protein